MNINAQPSGYFFKLPQSKQEKIIQAAMDEFARQGYQSASTNTIIKNADIGKGMLFRYFISKENLYLYIVGLCYRVTLNRLESSGIDECSNPFERLRRWFAIKSDLFINAPSILAVLTAAVSDPPERIKKELLEDLASFRKDLYKQLQDNADMSSFSGKDLQKVINMIVWLSEAVFDNLIQECTSNKEGPEEMLEHINSEYDEYIELLKYGICNTAQYGQSSSDCR